MRRADVVFIYTMIIITTEISDSEKCRIAWAVGVAYEICLVLWEPSCQICCL